MGKTKRTLEIVACFLVYTGKILIAQRQEKDNYGSLWEFPGGEIEKEETHPQALKREIREELNIDVEVGELLGVFFDENKELRIKVYLYRCSYKSGKIEARECADFKFVDKEELLKVNLAPLDSKIKEFVSSGKITL